MHALPKAALTAAIFAATTLAAQAQSRCRVMDPTSTPLNVRTAPNGRIVGALPNGLLVTVLDRATDGVRKLPGGKASAERRFEGHARRDLDTHHFCAGAVAKDDAIFGIAYQHTLLGSIQCQSEGHQSLIIRPARRAQAARMHSGGFASFQRYGL